MRSRARTVRLWLGGALLLAALIAQGERASRKLAADRTVGAVGRTARLVAAGELPPRVLVPWIRELRAAREKDPGSLRVRAARGDLFLLLGRAESAVRAYDDALALEPRGELYFNRSQALERLGRTEEADEDRRRALVLDPTLRREVRRRRGGEGSKGRGGT